MLTINRKLNGDGRLEYVEADLFDYEAESRYDLIFAGFWPSHVPKSRFESFWHMVAEALAPNGSVVMVDDGIRDPQGVSTFADDPTGSDAHRKLWDGQGFTIVKNAYNPSDLEARLGDLGWSATVTPQSSAIYVLAAKWSKGGGAP